jgi:hypothetical protein
MLLKLATLGALGYAGYKFYEKSMSGSDSTPAREPARSSAGDPGPLREGADTDGAGSGGIVAH